MERKEVFIDAGRQDMSRPKERPPKKTWKTELIKIGLRIYQLLAPSKVAEIIWVFFTTPIKPRFTQKQQEIIDEAEKRHYKYKGSKIVSYKWGSGNRRILLAHGWNSKIADFRRMIVALVESGYTVEGIDMRAHGKSEGKRTALPEYRDLMKDHITKEGKYDAMIGYSLGGIAAGLTISEIPVSLRPQHFFIIATPPYVRYFFESVVKDDVGCNHSVYLKMCDLVEKYYQENIDYADLRIKKKEFEDIQLHLIYDKDDQTVPFEKGLELRAHYPHANWVQSKGLGHYKVIAYHEVIDYIKLQLSEKELIENA